MDWKSDIMQVGNYQPPSNPERLPYYTYYIIIYGMSVQTYYSYLVAHTYLPQRDGPACHTLVAQFCYACKVSIYRIYMASLVE